MYCTHCGKQIEDNNQSCPYCGKDILVDNTDDSKETVTKNADTTANTSKIVKLILSFVIGMVLSFVTFLLIENSFLTNLALIIILWIGIGLIAYIIILQLSGSKGISGLGSIIIGGIGMLILSRIIGYWIEAVESADTGFGVFFALLPIGLIWTLIIYFIASATDNGKSEN